jgi:hypothetical protein
MVLAEPYGFRLRLVNPPVWHVHVSRERVMYYRLRCLTVPRPLAERERLASIDGSTTGVER